MEIKLKENERIDDLQINDLKIIQNKEGFCFGIDAVLLANFVKVKKNAKLIDLGTGTGIIPILIAGKSDLNNIIGIDIQSDVCEMANRSICLNSLEERVEILNVDLKKATEVFDKNSFDIVVSNPPYMHSEGLININDRKAISRHEVKCNLEDVFVTANSLLKPNGKFFMINRPNRLVDILFFGRKNNIEAKKIRFVHSKVGKAAKLVLIEFIKNAKAEVKMLEPLYVYNEDGTYTEEIVKIYSNKRLEVVR